MENPRAASVYCLKRKMHEKEGVVTERVYAVRVGTRMDGGMEDGRNATLINLDSKFLYHWHGPFV